MKQRTLSKSYSFEGKGLHSGAYARMEVCPAPCGTGIRFHRVDLGERAFVDAVAENVSSTSRSTTVASGKVSAGTIEHILSALTGLGVDNALIRLDAPEVPILDGSAGPYMEAMSGDPLVEQEEDRVWVELDGPFEYKEPGSGAYLRLEPADEPSYDVTIDFGSKVLGVQRVKWDAGVDYASEVAPCRTFCFLHEIRLLLTLGLIKGGDVENAIVIVEKPVSDRQLGRMAKRFNQPALTVKDGYLSNVRLHFPDECGRHKLLDVIGDLRLLGGFPKAHVTAYKPGHSINTKAAKQCRAEVLRNTR